MNKTLKIVLLNKTVLSNGVVGPEYTPMTMTVEELIQNLKVIKPTPRVAYAQNIAKEITLEALEAMVKDDLISADSAAAILEAEKIKEQNDLSEKKIEVPAPVVVADDVTPVDGPIFAEEENADTVADGAEVTDEIISGDEVVEKLEDGTPVITNQTQGNKKRR